MALTEKQRRQKLLEVRTGQEFHNLYFEVFGEEFPETVTRNPNDDIDKISQAIYDNKAVERVVLPKGAKIWYKNITNMEV
mgnify:FL=1